MNQNKILHKLTAEVMSERQAKVFLALLQMERATSAELQRASGVPHSKMSETLSHLLKGGYLTVRKIGRKRMYEVIDPIVSMNSNITDLESRIDSLKDLTSDLAQIYSRRGQFQEPLEYIEIFNNKEIVFRKYIDFLHSASSDIRAIMRPPLREFTKDELKELHDAFEDFYLKRDGRIRGIFEINENSPGQMIEAIETSYENDENYRICDQTPLKLDIFDGEILLLYDWDSTLDENEMTMSVIKERTTVKGYVDLFDHLWEHGLEYPEWKEKNGRLIEYLRSKDKTRKE